MHFTWDPDKAEANRAKHGVSFEEAAELFTSGVDYLEIFDEAHAMHDERFLAIGPIRRGVLIVWTAVEDDIVRLVSARMATLRERRLYQAHMEAR